MEFKKTNLRDEFKKDKDIETPVAENHVEYIYWLENRIVNAEAVNKNALLANVSARTLDIGSAANVIKAMPLNQAIQLMKSDITGLPQTQVIEGELIVAYVR